MTAEGGLADSSAPGMLLRSAPLCYTAQKKVFIRWDFRRPTLRTERKAVRLSFPCDIFIIMLAVAVRLLTRPLF